MELALSCKFPFSQLFLDCLLSFSLSIGDEAHRLILVQKNSILVEVYWEILLSFSGAKLVIFGVGCFRFYIIGFRKNIKTSNNEQFRQ